MRRADGCLPPGCRDDKPLIRGEEGGGDHSGVVLRRRTPFAKENQLFIAHAGLPPSGRSDDGKLLSMLLILGS